MKALVTGASGFVGYSVAKALLEEGMQVKVMLRSTSPSKYLKDLDVELCQADLLQKDTLKEALKNCNYLFHVAAHYSLWEKDPSIFYKINVQGTKDLFTVAAEENIEKIVYTSSVATIKLAKDGSSVDETSIGTLEDMVGEYKRSKFLAEEEVVKMAKEGANITIVNPSAPIGPFDVKPTPTGKIILDFLHRKMPAYMETGLNWVAVEDVAKGHILALHQGKKGERYILGGENLRLIEVLRILQEITGLSAPKVRMPYSIAYSVAVASLFFAKMVGKAPAIPPDGVKMAKKFMFFDSSKAKNELGYQTTPIKDALSRAVDWFRANGYC